MQSGNNVIRLGDWKDLWPSERPALVIADPVYDNGDGYKIACRAIADAVPAVVFCYPNELCGFPKPDQICHWIKPESTKNTARRYSRFVECLAMYNVDFYGKTHWSNRTGIFTDRLVDQIHPWQKPESLIRRLLTNHYPGRGFVLDPCAGSFTIDRVCRSLGIPSFSIEIDPVWYNKYSTEIGE